MQQIATSVCCFNISRRYVCLRTSPKAVDIAERAARHLAVPEQLSACPASASVGEESWVGVGDRRASLNE
eukprot:2107588-Rhodomonas_salina.4